MPSPNIARANSEISAKGKRVKAFLKFSLQSFFIPTFYNIDKFCQQKADVFSQVLTSRGLA
jgi:hypothetical protein